MTQNSSDSGMMVMLLGLLGLGAMFLLTRNNGSSQSSPAGGSGGSVQSADSNSGLATAFSSLLGLFAQQQQTAATNVPRAPANSYGTTVANGDQLGATQLYEMAKKNEWYTPVSVNPNLSVIKIGSSAPTPVIGAFKTPEQDSILLSASPVRSDQVVATNLNSGNTWTGNNPTIGYLYGVGEQPGCGCSPRDDACVTRCNAAAAWRSRYA